MRMVRIFSGVLRVWGVAGTVGTDPADANGFVIAPGTGPKMQVLHSPPGWALTLRDPASGTDVPLGRYAGLPGLLRGMREQLAPDAPSGRLVIGTQQILARNPGPR